MIRIVTESMSDFTQEEAKAADLIVMPLPIRFGMEEYWDCLLYTSDAADD